MTNDQRPTTLILFLPLLLMACTTPQSDSEAIRQLCIEMTENYPAATLQDIYKTCYQDFFGAEHLMRDTAAARYYLHEELEACRDQDLSSMPLREPTGFRHRFVRINLQNIFDGTVTEDELLRLFIAAASSNNASSANSASTNAGSGNAFSDDWPREWQLIETIALEVHPSWADEELQQALRQAADLRRAVRHSDPFRAAYHPHYRIIRNQP